MAKAKDGAVEVRKIAGLRPHPKNPRTHPESQIDGLQKSFDTFGVKSVIVVDEKNKILAGHGRVAAAKKAGLKELPVIVARGWTEKKKLAFMVADNRHAELAGWDDSLLRENIAALQLDGFDISSIGYDDAALAELLAQTNAGAGDAEEVPAPPKKPIVRMGDLWVLGEHRLLCGDSTKAEDVALVIGKDKPNLMITDPPYGVEYDPAWRADANKWKGSKVKFGAKAMGKVSNDHAADWREAWKLFTGDVVYVWHGGLRSVEQAQSLEDTGFIIRSQIIWDKQRLVISRGDYHWQHEACWYAVRKGKTAHWNGSRTQSTVWDIPKPQASETGHGTQKPVDCMKRPMENNSRKGEFVYEPFCGSGTTIIAGEMTGRRVLAIEIDPSYVQVAIERWTKFAGKIATLDGQSFDQVAAARRKGKPRGAKHATRDIGKPIRGRSSKVDTGVAATVPK